MAGAVADSFFPPNPAALMLNKHSQEGTQVLREERPPVRRGHFSRDVPDVQPRPRP